jgi:hypothetical protein
MLVAGYYASTSLTSENQTGAIPDVIGKTVQDFMFNLDWEIADTRVTDKAATSLKECRSKVSRLAQTCRGQQRLGIRTLRSTPGLSVSLRRSKLQRPRHRLVRCDHPTAAG